MLVKILAIALITLLARPADPADPADPAAVLLELEQGGLGGHFRPRVEVLADGTVRVDGVAAATKLARGELAKLIEFVVEKQGFFKIDGKKLKQKHAKVPPLAIADFSRLAEIPGKGKCAIFNRHETNPPRAVSAQVPVKDKQADVTVNVQQ